MVAVKTNKKFLAFGFLIIFALSSGVVYADTSENIGNAMEKLAGVMGAFLSPSFLEQENSNEKLGFIRFLIFIITYIFISFGLSKMNLPRNATVGASLAFSAFTLFIPKKTVNFIGDLYGGFATAIFIVLVVGFLLFAVLSDKFLNSEDRGQRAIKWVCSLLGLFIIIWMWGNQFIWGS